MAPRLNLRMENYGLLATDWVRGWVSMVLLLSVMVMVPAGGPWVAKDRSQCFEPSETVTEVVLGGESGFSVQVGVMLLLAGEAWMRVRKLSFVLLLIVGVIVMWL